MPQDAPFGYHHGPTEPLDAIERELLLAFDDSPYALDEDNEGLDFPAFLDQLWAPDPAAVISGGLTAPSAAHAPAWAAAGGAAQPGGQAAPHTFGQAGAQGAFVAPANVALPSLAAPAAAATTAAATSSATFTPASSEGSGEGPCPKAVAEPYGLAPPQAAAGSLAGRPQHTHSSMVLPSCGVRAAPAYQHSAQLADAAASIVPSLAGPGPLVALQGAFGHSRGVGPLAAVAAIDCLAHHPALDSVAAPAAGLQGASRLQDRAAGAAQRRVSGSGSVAPCSMLRRRCGAPMPASSADTSGTRVPSHDTAAAAGPCVAAAIPVAAPVAAPSGAGGSAGGAAMAGAEVPMPGPTRKRRAVAAAALKRSPAAGAAGGGNGAGSVEDSSDGSSGEDSDDSDYYAARAKRSGKRPSTGAAAAGAQSTAGATAAVAAAPKAAPASHGGGSAAAAARRRAQEVDWRTIEDPAERRRQRRLAKNRATAARSRERRREQWDEMVARMATLEDANGKLRAQVAGLQADNSQLRARLAGFTKGAASAAGALAGMAPRSRR